MICTWQLPAVERSPPYLTLRRISSSFSDGVRAQIVAGILLTESHRRQLSHHLSRTAADFDDRVRLTYLAVRGAPNVNNVLRLGASAKLSPEDLTVHAVKFAIVLHEAIVALDGFPFLSCRCLAAEHQFIH